MNVLVDTNVVISAVIRDRLPQRVINEIVSRDDWFWIVTTEIETEYREVLARPKFKAPAAIQQSWRALVEEITVRVSPITPPPFPRDPKASFS
jgi:putative PIN family toxin of toxin-antitoxin system